MRVCIAARELAEKFGRRVRNLVAEHCHTLDVHVVIDIDPVKRIYLLDLWRRQGS
jgi:hypothetical protein